MNDLGPEAKSLFAAAREAEGLPGPKRDRIKHAVLVQAATLGAASTVAGGAVAMSMAAKVTLVTVTAAVLGGGSVSLWAWKKHEESTHAARPVPARSHAGLVAKPTGSREIPKADAPAPVPTPEAVPVPVETQRRAAKPAAGVKARPKAEAPVLPSGEPPSLAARFSDPPLVAPATPVWEPLRPAPDLAETGRVPARPSPVTEVTAHAVVKGPAPDPVSLDAELSLLRQAQEDLRLGLPAQALYRIAEFDRRFPKARLDQERQAIEVIARCQAHPGPAALARAQQFLRQAPLSPLAARVRSACQQDESRSANETGARREP